LRARVILPAATGPYSGAAGAGLFGGESRSGAISIQDALDEFVEGVTDQGVDGEFYQVEHVLTS
jgi:hypothetical protein